MAKGNTMKSSFYKIVSDGTTDGTELYDPDGNKMGMVQKMKIQAFAKESRIRVDLVQIEQEDTPSVIPSVEFDIKVSPEVVNIKKIALCKNCSEFGEYDEETELTDDEAKEVYDYFVDRASKEIIYDYLRDEVQKANRELKKIVDRVLGKSEDKEEKQ